MIILNSKRGFLPKAVLSETNLLENAFAIMSRIAKLFVYFMHFFICTCIFSNLIPEMAIAFTKCTIRNIVNANPKEMSLNPLHWTGRVKRICYSQWS